MLVRTGMYHFEVSRTAMYRVRYWYVPVHIVMYCLVPGVQDSRCAQPAAPGGGVPGRRRRAPSLRPPLGRALGASAATASTELP